MNEALLLCALARRGAPGSAGDLTDDAVGIAQSAGWPERTWSGVSVRAVSRLLQSMVEKGAVVRAAARRENGREVPLYGLSSYDRAAPVPPPPDPVGEDHPLHGLTTRQRFVLFDAQDAWLALLGRHAAELRALVDRHTRELAELAERNRRDLLAAGLTEGR